MALPSNQHPLRSNYFLADFSSEHRLFSVKWFSGYANYFTLKIRNAREFPQAVHLKTPTTSCWYFSVLPSSQGTDKAPLITTVPVLKWTAHRLYQRPKGSFEKDIADHRLQGEEGGHANVDNSWKMGGVGSCNFSQQRKEFHVPKVHHTSMDIW